MARSKPKERPEGDAGPSTRGRPLPRWKKVLLTLAVLAMVAGGAGYAFAMLRGDPEPVPTSTGTGADAGQLAQGFAAGDTPTGESVEGGGEPSGSPFDIWSPAVFRLGFSFFAGFAMGFAARTFFKISIAAIGVGLLALIGLQYANVIDVNWAAMQEHYDKIAQWITTQTGSIKDLISGYLPSTASAVLGLGVGFKK